MLLAKPPRTAPSNNARQPDPPFADYTSRSPPFRKLWWVPHR
jgi:hypothetical protein